jgi:hypothetical protein
MTKCMQDEHRIIVDTLGDYYAHQGRQLKVTARDIEEMNECTSPADYPHSICGPEACSYWDICPKNPMYAVS